MRRPATAADGWRSNPYAYIGARILGARGGPRLPPRDIEKDLSSYYAQRDVEAIILLKVDTQRADDIAHSLSRFDQIRHAYLVTGEDDIIIKAQFGSYRELKDFIIKALAPLEGVEDTKTMMVVTTYKEGGKILE